MDVHFLKSYCQLLIQTCHRRGIHAMGGMAAQIPIKTDPLAHENAMNKVIADKKREVSLGHDGTWVAHPGLVELAQKVFEEAFSGPNQIQSNLSSSIEIKQSDLLKVPTGEITEEGLRTNVNVSLLYLESWLRGFGCVPLYHLMEDAATAEISRAQIWQWIRHSRIKKDDYFRVLSEEQLRIRTEMGDQKYSTGKFEMASQLLTELVTGQEFVDFLTLPAYSYL
jgi:malate synthase